jgi:hypothetical protein
MAISEILGCWWQRRSERDLYNFNKLTIDMQRRGRRVCSRATLACRLKTDMKGSIKPLDVLFPRLSSSFLLGLSSFRRINLIIVYSTKE